MLCMLTSVCMSVWLKDRLCVCLYAFLCVCALEVCVLLCVCVCLREFVHLYAFLCVCVRGLCVIVCVSVWVCVCVSESVCACVCSAVATSSWKEWHWTETEKTGFELKVYIRRDQYFTFKTLIFIFFLLLNIHFELIIKQNFSLFIYVQIKKNIPNVINII
jgi:hypothetical protein